MLFTATASNLTHGLDRADSQGYVRDMTTGATTLVTRQSDSAGGAPANVATVAVALSGDGRYMLFLSNAANLAAGADSLYHLYRRDRQTGVTDLVDALPGSPRTPGDSSVRQGSTPVADMSADGRYVAFTTDAANLGAATGGSVLVRDMQTGTIVPASRKTGPLGDTVTGTSPAISDDGNRVLFESAETGMGDGDTLSEYDLFVRDLRAGTTRVVSRPAGDATSPDDGSSDGGALSADGRFAAYSTDSTVFDPDDGDTTYDGYVRDLGAVRARRAGEPPRQPGRRERHVRLDG